MPTLLDPTDRETILERLRRLTPSSEPNWGTLTAPRLLCHLADQLRVAVGDGSSSIRRFGLRQAEFAPLPKC